MKRALLPAAALLALFLACGNDRLRRSSEGVQVVAGEPTVGQGLPGVTRLDGGVAGVFGSAAPFQADSFDQQDVQKVDILWVIDDSPSMQPKQQRVKDNFTSFMTFLTQQHIDYHLGVTTTDTFDPAQSGRLDNKAGLSHPWIDALAMNPQVAFVQNASVGVAGSGDEKGLLGGMFALTPPLSPATPAASAANCAAGADGGPECFLRKDAALYTIIVSDEEDSSCSPINAAQEGCDPGQINLGGYGSTDYWTRFYLGAKGLGGVSRLAAIVATDDSQQDCAAVFAHECDAFVNAACAGGNHNDCNLAGNRSDPCCQAIYGTGSGSCYGDLHEKAQYCGVTAVASGGKMVAPYYQVYGSWNGCVASHVDPNSNKTVVDFTAFSGQRYAAVAAGTHGVATSICDADYTPALEKLGLQASGLRADFPLSRAPIPSSIAVLVDNAPVPASSWRYVACESPAPPGASPHPPVNSIRFAQAALPHPGAKIAASYDVNVHGLAVCP